MTTQEGRLCLTRGLPRQGLPHLGSPLAVPAHPSSLVLLWVPSRNGRPCVQRRTTASQAQARALALDVNSAPSIAKSAVYNCPTDDGTQVLAYFRASETTTVVSGTQRLAHSSQLSSPALAPRLSRCASYSVGWRRRMGYGAAVLADSAASTPIGPMSGGGFPQLDHLSAEDPGILYWTGRDVRCFVRRPHRPTPRLNAPVTNQRVIVTQSCR